MVIPQGFTSVTDADGLKITDDGKVFQLIVPSDGWLRDRAFGVLDTPGEQSEQRIFPGGRWQRINDYGAAKRNWTERDTAGNIVQVFQTDISTQEVESRLVREDLIESEEAVRAVGGNNPLKDPLLQLIRYLKGSDPRVAAVEITTATVNVIDGDTVNVEVRMSRTFDGLAGFNFEARIAHSATARFNDVIFPASFPLATHRPDPVSGPTLTSVAGVDLGSSIQGAQTDVLLFTLVVEATQVGETFIDIVVNALDDDSGFPVTSVVKSGQIVVS